MRLQATYASLDSKWGGSEHDQAEGMVLGLIRQAVPDAQIRAIFGIGGSMIARLKNVVANGVDTLHTRRIASKPKHALTDDDISFFLSACQEWELEDGFPCSHRGPRQYLVEEAMTWRKLWERYKTKATLASRRIIAYTRWIQYVHFHFPGVRLSRTKEDLCDACVRIDIALLRQDLTDEERSALEAEKAMHLSAAIGQRRAMSAFVKQYIAAHAPNQAAPDEVVADNAEEAPRSSPIEHSSIPAMQIQIEDFGGSFPLPVYGNKRPSADYFNSNLMMHNFVVADITNSINNVFVYDERAQGKGVDALCSLRLHHHLRLRKKYVQAGVLQPEKSIMLLLILDNCVGQNKSRMVFAFYAMLSVVFYKKVTLLYLLPGHSHNAADRVVAWCRRSVQGENLYTPEHIVARMNTTASVQAEFLDHRSTSRPFFTGWSRLLSKYFKNMPSGYTANYFFEFDDGVVTMKHLVATEDPVLDRFSLIGEGDASSIRIRSAFLEDLFGTVDLNQAEVKDLRLPRQDSLSLTTKKLRSLALKYFSIPDQVLFYP